MRRSRFSDEQTITILKEHAAGLGTAELCRKHGISDATFYHLWTALPVQAFRGTDLTKRGADIYPASPVFGAPKWVIRRAWSSTSGRPRGPL